MSTVGTICWQLYEPLEVTCYDYHKLTCLISSQNAQAGVDYTRKLAFYIVNFKYLEFTACQNISFSDPSQSFCAAKIGDPRGFYYLFVVTII